MRSRVKVLLVKGDTHRKPPAHESNLGRHRQKSVKPTVPIRYNPISAQANDPTPKKGEPWLFGVAWPVLPKESRPDHNRVRGLLALGL